MTDKVVQIKRGRKKATKPPPQLPDLDRVRMMSMSRMTHPHMALLLGITDEQFEEFKEIKEFRDALEKGRAEAIFQCASVVLSATQGRLGTPVLDQDKKIIGYEFGDREKEQLKAAKEYLKSHAPNWLSDGNT